MEARAARFDEEDQLKKLRTLKVQERNAKLNALTANNNSTIKEPACWGMCPEFEMIDRQVTNDVSIFEAQIPFNPPQGKLIIDPGRAVKKFRRSAAGNYELSEDLRPPEVLLATTIYLMRDVLGDERWPANNVPFSVLYAFIRDRLRAIRTDLTLQNCKNLNSIRIHEISIRFLIAAGHLLCEEERAAFEPQQNNEQLNGCLSALREMYKSVRLTMPVNYETLLKYEAEFQAYSIILSVDKKEAAVAISSLPIDLLCHDAIQVALEAYSAFQQTNYIKFLNLIRDETKSTYLQACLLHQFVLPVRQRALNVMISIPEAYKSFPVTDLIRWFAFVDQDELFYYADRFGFKILNNQIVDFSALCQRGEVVDLRAEEENFKVRMFQAAIEERRLKRNLGLSAIMFEGIDLDFGKIMGVLEIGGNKSKLTSEFLVASTSSPIPKQKHQKNLMEPSGNVKKFFTSKLAMSDNVMNTADINTNVNNTFNTVDIVNTANTMDIANTTNTSNITNSSNTLATFTTNINPIQKTETVIDHQAILRKKLETQAQERRARADKVISLSEGMLEALIDSVVGFQVSEVCALTWDRLWREGRQNRQLAIENMAIQIYEDILKKEVLPNVLDIELMKIRSKAADSLSTKQKTIQQSTFSILNTLEGEIYEEIVLESWLEFKRINFMKRKWFNRLLRGHRAETGFNWTGLFESVKKQSFPKPVHLLFLGNSKILEPLIKNASPPNPLGYLQTFLKSNDDNMIKMIWSENQEIGNTFFLSHADGLISEWPSNYPGPTVIIAPNSKHNPAEFNYYNLNLPWKPEIVLVDPVDYEKCSSEVFKQIFDYSLKISIENVDLPVLQENLTVSQIIPIELIESFVIEPFEKEGHDADNNNDNADNNELLINLTRGILERITWTLFKSPPASNLLSHHPITAGRSKIIDSIRKSSSIPDAFVNIFKSCKSIHCTLNSLDQIYGPIFTCNPESLYTTQTISDLIRVQNEILSQSRKRLRIANDRAVMEKEFSIEILKEKLKLEANESEAYEEFLKKFL